MVDGTGFDLAGRVALVTGASPRHRAGDDRGVRRGGARVVISSRKQEALEALPRSRCSARRRCAARGSSYWGYPGCAAPGGAGG